jgi:NADH dehydrogenase (ubiquinone) 1 alpha subcomplex subunit 12
VLTNQVFGNKFYENTEEDEIHLRTRWVIYKERYYDMSQIEPAWHGWLGDLVDTPPNQTKAENLTVRSYPVATERFLNFTGTRGAYRPYNTTKPKVTPWQPKVGERL